MILGVGALFGSPCSKSPIAGSPHIRAPDFLKLPYRYLDVFWLSLRALTLWVSIVFIISRLSV